MHLMYLRVRLVARPGGCLPAGPPEDILGKMRAPVDAQRRGRHHCGMDNLLKIAPLVILVIVVAAVILRGSRLSKHDKGKESSGGPGDGAGL